MVAPYGIKGSAIRMKFEFVRNRFGAAAEQAMRDHFKGCKEMDPLLDTAWIPFTVYEEINQYIARTHYNGNLSRLEEVGAYSAENGLQSTYRVWVRGKQFIEFLGQFREYYRTFYSVGDMFISIGEDHQSAVLNFRNAPIYTVAELHIATGYFLGACRVMGLADVKHSATMSPDGMEIRLSWR